MVAGQDDPIRIDVPKGSYVPTFTLRSSGSTSDGIDADEAPALQGRTVRRLRRLSAAGALAAAVLLIIGGGWLTVHWKVQQPQAEMPAAPSPSAGDHSRPSIIVMPFENLSGDPGQGYFARGIAADIVRRLIRYSELTVFDGASLDRGETNILDLRRKLDAGYILAGSVQRTANQIRVSSQLIDNGTEAVLWADTLSEDLSTVDLFAIQDDIGRAVARTVAQPYGVIFQDALRDRAKAPRSLKAYDCVLRNYEYRRQWSRELHAEVRDCLERAVAEEPEYADAWGFLSLLYLDELRYGYNRRPGYDPLDKAQESARRAVALTPDGAVALQALLNVHVFRSELEEAFAIGEHALATNPDNPEIQAIVGLPLAFAGQWERGMPLVEQAIATSLAPPGWYFGATSLNFFRQGRYEEALREAHRMDMPDYLYSHVILAAICGQMGRDDEGRTAVKRLLALAPDFGTHARERLAERFQDPALLDQVLDGLRKAGMDIPGPVTVN